MKEPNVIVCVEGGVVINVYSNVHDLGVVILDYDGDNVNEEAQSTVTFVRDQEKYGNVSTEYIQVY